MQDEIVFGIDMQAKLRISVPAPPKSIANMLPKCRTGGLTVQTPEERERLEEVLKRELKRFEDVHGQTNKIQHFIRLKDETPIKQRYRPHNPAMQAIIDQEVDEMLRQKLIEPSHSP